MRKISLLLLLFFYSLTSSAEIRLPAVIGSHMVLQQNSLVTIWGWSDAEEKIKLKTGWDSTSYTTTGSSSANWSIQVRTPSAGGPYQIMIEGYNKIVLDDVMLGEVWICSGQSNMEMNVNWGLPYQDEVQHATDKEIRFFYIPRTTAAYPQDDVKAEWIVCNPEDMKRFSAVAYFFGKRIREKLNIPVGLINTSWGGTPAETWTPIEFINNDPILKQAATTLKPSPGWPVIPASTYNAMIHPLRKYVIAGAIWYQGEANVDNASTYQRLLTTMITSWRMAWQKDFPFYFVQIAPFEDYGDNSPAAFLREAQEKTLALPGTGMVLTTDLVDNINDIHPKMKKEVGERLANCALSETYGIENIAYKYPRYREMEIEKDKVRVYFDNAEKGLVSKGNPITEFFLASEDKHFVPAHARIEGNSIVVWNENIKKPVAVRFAFRNGPVPNLFNKDGLPVCPFRTDDWPVQIIINKK